MKSLSHNNYCLPVLLMSCKCENAWLSVTEYFRCRNFRVEKLSRKEKCAKFCAFRVDKLSRMDPIGKFCVDKLSRMENVFY